MGSEGAKKQNPFSSTENGEQAGSKDEYCMKWLTAIASTSQQNKTRCLSQQHPPESCADSFGSSNSNSYQSAQASPRFKRHHILHHPALAAIDLMASEDPVGFSETIIHESSNATPYKGSKYEKRPRHKTRPDRYDPHRQRRSDAETSVLSRRERRNRKRERLRLRREVMNNFYSSAVETRRVLVRGDFDQLPSAYLQLTNTADR